MTIGDAFAVVGTVTAVTVVAGSIWITDRAGRRQDRRRTHGELLIVRQKGIDDLRDALADITASLRRLHAAGCDGIAQPQLAARVLDRLDYVRLKLDPVEPHPAMVRTVLEALCATALPFDHLRGVIARPPIGATDFDLLARWTIALGQLVLKIEWVVASRDADQVTGRVARQWNGLMRFEHAHAAGLARLAPAGWRLRQQDARYLTPRPPAHRPYWSVPVYSFSRTVFPAAA